MMKNCFVGLTFVALVVLAKYANASPYFEDEEDLLPEQRSEADYNDNSLDNLLHTSQQKRACVRRNGICDHRPNDCCYSSSCRCSLWGTNCRCQRVGIFQKWG